VAVKWLIPEVDSEKAVSLRDGFVQRIHDLIAPDFSPIEVAHALTKAERQGRVTAAQVSQFLFDFIHLVPELHPALPLLPDAVALSLKKRIGIYDCVYIALAEREQCKVVTADERLANHFPAQTISLSSIP
jgi:predicted nucleic acid-binding protein